MEDDLEFIALFAQLDVIGYVEPVFNKVPPFNAYEDVFE
jgi:hypothetical protein